MYNENGVAENYNNHAASYCRPIASTLALHPSYEEWVTVLKWTSNVKIGRWAIADGVLRISKNISADDELLQNEHDNEKEGIIKQLAKNATALAVWEMKSLTVGTAQVMQEVANMGQTPAEFPWKKCTPADCEHDFLDSMKESAKYYDAGFDPLSPPWTLPIVPSTLGESRRSASVQSGTTARPSCKETSMSPVDGEEEREKRPRSDPDVPEAERPLKKQRRKSKADLWDESSYELPPGARKEVNAQSFLQQVAYSSLVQISILTVSHLHLDMGRGGA